MSEKKNSLCKQEFVKVAKVRQSRKSSKPSEFNTANVRLLFLLFTFPILSGSFGILMHLSRKIG